MSVPNPSQPKRRSSMLSKSPEDVVALIDSQPGRTPVIVKHGKYIITGLLGCWWVDLPNGILRVLQSEDGWIRKMLIAALGLYLATVIMFLYLVLFIPWLRGYIPNASRESARLRIIVPLLTISILGSWTFFVISFSQAGKQTMMESVLDAFKGVGNASLEQMEGRDGMGVLSSMVGATALFIFTLGVLGLIPAPSYAAKRKR
nr:hypothetical protein L204_04318 [Cryptococcus depauperatus CBS 7855]